MRDWGCGMKDDIALGKMQTLGGCGLGEDNNGLNSDPTPF